MSTISPQLEISVDLYQEPTEFISFQLSYSTAEIEKSIFFSKMTPERPLSLPSGSATMLIVDGNLFPLEDIDLPSSIPLTEKAGAFKIMGLDQE